MTRPREQDYTSHVAYCRALEDYCDAKPSMTHLISQMLEAMEVWSDARLSAQGQKAITAAREYLAAPEQSEPVGYFCKDDFLYYEAKDECIGDDDVFPLYRYRHPAPQTTELTDDELSKLWDDHTVPVFDKTGINPIVYARAVLAAQRSKT